ncbi:MAG: 3-deoxy-D-manno-octulosonic acid transferase, partial [Rhodobacteraceae bacterium]|nr:3-deoxy-D-manno-octulosonic acid transferase [Paracoccaceae bacterium]
MILYQLVMALALPFLLAHQALFGAKGAVVARLGLGPAPRPGLTLWLHAASVGEVTSARWVIEAVLAARPGLQILVTTNTATGRARVRSWGLPQVTAALAPFDSAGAAARVLDRWHPQALVVVENEMWPARLRAADNRGVPILVIGARISARSARRWRVLAGLGRGMLGRIAWVSAQDQASIARLLALGLPATARGPVLALKAMGQAATQSAPLPFPPPAPRAATLLAASTHEGEEPLVLDAFAAQSQFSQLILAPRHPRRGDEVAALLSARGLIFARRTAGQVPGPETVVFLADTLG